MRLAVPCLVLNLLAPWGAVAAPPSDDPAAVVPDRTTEILRYGCSSDLGRREVTLFGNGTIRLRDGSKEEDWMGLGELNPDEVDGVINRLKEEDLSEVGKLPEGVEGNWVETCTLSFQIPGKELQVYHFGRYDTLPLPLSRVVRVAEDVAAKVRDLKGKEELPVDYQPRPMDILKRRDGELYRVLGFTGDKLGVELEGVDVPLTVYIPKGDMRREFVALVERKTRAGDTSPPSPSPKPAPDDSHP
jgi:hypothetical protein